jgi:IS5 family transposase
VKRFGDTAYLGTGMRTPKRKPRGGALTARQRRGNRRLARRRIVAEHGIGKMKVWRVVADRYRGPRSRHTLVFKNVAGLHNLMFA